MMKAEIILIGDELLNGRVLDINGAYMASQLSSWGFNLEQISIVGDDPEELNRAVGKAWKYSDLVLTTGGLGPTKDDITKEIIAECFEAPLEENSKARQMVEKHYARHKSFPPSENRYHFIPQGFLPIENPCGLAVGLSFVQSNKMFIALPGVPKEMRQMLEENIRPLLFSFFPNLSSPETFVIRTAGVTEEDIFLKRCPKLWSKLETFGKVSSLPQGFGIDIIVTLTQKQDCIQAKEDMKKEILNSPLAKNVWQFGDLSLEAFVLEMARKKKLTFALAESCTGGAASSLITDCPGSSDCFLGSTVTYSNASKNALLNISEISMKKEGAVSVCVAERMAQEARRLFKADMAVSLTGIAGPSGGTPAKPVGTLTVGRSSAYESAAKEYLFVGDREKLKLRFAQQGLITLLRLLQKAG